MSPFLGLTCLRSPAARLSRAVPLIALMVACQSPDDAQGPAGSGAAVAGGPTAEWVLALATPPGMPVLSQHSGSMLRGPADAGLRPSFSVGPIVGLPEDISDGFPNSSALGLNASGQLAGFGVNPLTGAQQAVRWDASGTPTVLPLESETGQGVATDLNDAGIVVGFDVETDPLTGESHAFASRWEANNDRSRLPAVPDVAREIPQGINNDGVVVGYVFQPAAHPTRAVRWDGSGVHILGDGAAMDVNAAGTAAGFTYVGDIVRPAAWSASGVLTLLTLPAGALSGGATSINSAGQVAGSVSFNNGTCCQTKAVSWAPDGTPTVFPSSGDGVATAVNDAGVVAGRITDNTIALPSPAAVLWVGTERTTVPLGSAFMMAVVNDINGAMLAGAAYPVGNPEETHAVRWSLTLPEPPFDFSGFFAPVQNPGPAAPYTINSVNAGRAVPIKFSLNGDRGLGILAPNSPTSTPVACTLSDTEGGEPTRSAGASGLSYSAASDQYSYIWKTDVAWAGTCRQLSLVLSDGMTHTALFRFN